MEPDKAIHCNQGLVTHITDMESDNFSLKIKGTHDLLIFKNSKFKELKLNLDLDLLTLF